MMLAEAKRKLEEWKQLQFFGGDALNLKEYMTTVTMPPDAAYHCWRIVMTPTKPEYTMPIDIRIVPTVANQYLIPQVEAVYRTDGSFEWLLIAGANYESTGVTSEVTITYSGAATFTKTTVA